MLIKYASNARYYVTDDGKSAERKPLPTAVAYSTYLSRDGDTLDLLAERIFRDFSRYWEIADINPHIKFPTKIPVGTVIRIPR